MKRLIPARVELAIFVVLAAICTVVVGLSPHRDYAIGLCTAPLFLASALMGFRRSEIGRLAENAEATDDSQTLV
jgi:hypothetical protein